MRSRGSTLAFTLALTGAFCAACSSDNDGDEVGQSVRRLCNDFASSQCELTLRCEENPPSRQDCVTVNEFECCDSFDCDASTVVAADTRAACLADVRSSSCGSRDSVFFDGPCNEFLLALASPPPPSCGSLADMAADTCGGDVSSQVLGACDLVEAFGEDCALFDEQVDTIRACIGDSAGTCGAPFECFGFMQVFDCARDQCCPDGSCTDPAPRCDVFR
ncbi:MAG: hypothetical protein AAF411_29560 [Myxococcota bacterium]